MSHSRVASVLIIITELIRAQLLSRYCFSTRGDGMGCLARLQPFGRSVVLHSKSQPVGCKLPVCDLKPWDEQQSFFRFSSPFLGGFSDLRRQCCLCPFDRMAHLHPHLLIRPPGITSTIPLMSTLYLTCGRGSEGKGVWVSYQPDVISLW